MNNFTLSSKSAIHVPLFLVLLTFSIPHKIWSMEETVQQSLLENLATELKMQVPLSTDQQLTKEMHKELGISKLNARFVLPLKAAREKLLERLTIISRYAFLHHNNLLHENGGIKNFLAGTSLTTVALKHAHEALHTLRKNNVNFWTNNNINDDYTRVTQPDKIGVDVSAYSSFTEGRCVAALLLYISENTESILKDCTAQDYLQRKDLLSLVYTQAHKAFYPTFHGVSKIGNTMLSRMHPIEK